MSQKRQGARKLPHNVNPRCEAAHEYAENGWQVLPCNGKIPLIKNWPNKATTDPKIIDEWWARWPDANVGILCGKRSGLIVIDVDKKNGGLDSLCKLEDEIGKLSTLTVRSGGGGKHMYFEYPTTCNVRSGTYNALGKGIDVQSDGRFIVAPPSVHGSGREYKRINDRDVSPMKNMLLKRIRNGKMKRKPMADNRAREARTGKVIKEGARNDFLASQAGKLHAAGFDPETILSNLLEVNNNRCEEPLPKEEVERIVKSISRYVTHELLSDMGNARRFAQQENGKILWCYDWGRSLAWNGQRWDRTTGEAEANRAAKEVPRNILVEAYCCKDEDQRNKIADWAKASQNSYRIDAMLKLAKSEPSITAYSNDFDQDDYLLNCLNGTINLRTGILQPHNPDDKITKLAPVKYPAKVGKKARVNPDKIQTWLRCLDQWMREDDGQIGYLQRLAGYCLTGDTTSRVFPVFHGGGRNGKSTFLDTLSGLMGDYASKAPETLLKLSHYDRHPTEIADLEGRRLVIASETKSNMKLKVALVKEMTGDKTMKGRAMRQDFHEFKITHKVILMTQNLPVIDEVTDAIWDRVHLVEWSYRVKASEQDTRLLEKLQAEWPYILAWAVEGCLKWQRAGRLKPTEDIFQATQKYRKQENPVKEFIDQCCLKKTDEYVTVQRLWTRYQKWAAEHKEQRKVSKEEFGRCLSQLGYKSKVIRLKGKNCRVRLDLKLKPW